MTTLVAPLDVRKCKIIPFRDQSTGAKRYKLEYDGKEIPRTFLTKKNLQLYIKNPLAYDNIVKGFADGVKSGYPLIYADRTGTKFQLRIDHENDRYVDPKGKTFPRKVVRQNFMFVRRIISSPNHNTEIA